MIYGTIPAAGMGARLQPLGFSKELAVVGEKAVIEYLLERMAEAGIKKIFVVIDPEKLDIPRYLSTKSPYKDNLIFIVNTKHSLIDDMLAPARFLNEKDILYFGLPDTIWYPKNGFNLLKRQKGEVVLGLFLSDHPENFGAVSVDKNNQIIKIEDKVPRPQTNWVWGIGKVSVKAARIIQNLLPWSDNPNERLLSAALDLYKEKHPCLGLKIDKSTYFDIGRKEDYKKANEFVEKHEALS